MKDLQTQNLYSQHTPTTLKDFVGQDATVSAFKQWMKLGKLPSTILISGLTGSGKTTFARLIERYVNCENLNACGKCRMCKQESRQNLTIVNGVSDGKKDDIRSLIDAAKFAPTSGRKRVIVIDEVHALQKQSEESLLVPIEKPSKNTIWIFCTTDPDQVRTTIKNRCARLSILPIDADIIADRLYSILKLEKMKIKDKKRTKKALSLIAEYSQGQMRNGISLLQSLMGSVCDGKKLDEQTMIQHIIQTDGQADLHAAQLLLSMLRYDLHATINTIVASKNIRELVSKLQYLIDWFIQYQVGAVKYKPNIAKIFDREVAALKKPELKQYEKTLEQGLPYFINIQDICLEILRTLNTVTIPERSLAQTWLTKAVVVDYNFTIKR
tara:strand:- start:4944 stop:6092 length:1149 start_codon:yes stop_codon:yes gene_type:complete